jgi:hypothetical protein
MQGGVSKPKYGQKALEPIHSRAIQTKSHLFAHSKKAIR